jgi:hypothetical protein
MRNYNSMRLRQVLQASTTSKPFSVVR